MANCKVCGKRVTAGAVVHTSCWEKAVKETAEIFCNDYCRFPGECESEDSLHEFHCDSCPMLQLVNLGL